MAEPIPADIQRLLISLGISSRYRGKQFLAEALCRLVEDPSLIHKLTTELYPAIAQENQTNCKHVAASIRHHARLLGQVRAESVPDHSLLHTR